MCRTVVVIFAPLRAVNEACLVVLRVLFEVLFVNVIHEAVLVLTLKGATHVMLLPCHVLGSRLGQLHMFFWFARTIPSN